MLRISVLLFLFSTSLPSRAMDITLMVGQQFNSDVEASAFEDRQPSQPFGTATSEKDVEFEDGAVVSLTLDFVFNDHPNQRIGFYASRQRTSLDSVPGLGRDNLDVTHIHFTAMNYYPSGKLEPYILAGVGAGLFSPDDPTLSSETQFSAQLGAGTNYQLSTNLLLRFDVRWIPTFFDSGGSAFCDGGCRIQLKSEVYNQVQANLGLLFRL
jgi:opacity protein-like surface antigen